MAAIENYLVEEGCCAATVAAVRRQWRANVFSHPDLGRRFRVSWGGGRLQVLCTAPSCLPSCFSTYFDIQFYLTIYDYDLLPSQF